MLPQAMRGRMAIMYLKPHGTSGSDSGADGASVPEAGAPENESWMEEIFRDHER
jgi:hypothetical protein